MLPYVTEIRRTSSSSGKEAKASSKARMSSTPWDIVRTKDVGRLNLTNRIRIYNDLPPCHVLFFNLISQSCMFRIRRVL